MSTETRLAAELGLHAANEVRETLLRICNTLPDSASKTKALVTAMSIIELMFDDLKAEPGVEKIVEGLKQSFKEQKRA